MTIVQVRHGFTEVAGVRVFHREAGPPDAPVVLLLHGFPSASHQYRRLMEVLGTRYRLIAPDLPGFGHTEVSAGFTYTFDRLSEVVEGFCVALGLDRFAMYVFDYGGPVGFRMAARHPGWITDLVVQNSNAYEEGLTELARGFIASRREDVSAIREVLTLEATRGQYEGGTGDVSVVAPDGWILDQYFLELPGREEIQIELALDYKSNVERYPEWHEYLRRYRPRTLILWGVNDPFFGADGAKAYLRDLPDARLHLFDTGHFALEEKLPEMAPLIDEFLGGQEVAARAKGSTAGAPA
ncbi:alpha/beta fold hydrolase [Amycolatopsis magusensis]|uniref:alpha/beta fold hydrolase n=1 Tax=Amycolatopsis magusensis TaxID=882444 RepID=UPI0024A8BE9A|nr:alpha/beta hydrolase [Amycolatopsis magusensis]MDI5978003.1 alpha/beta hydrolase [Amycolatopsis magusensis]